MRRGTARWSRAPLGLGLPLMAALLVCAAGCKDEQECEKTRMHAASSWEEVKNQAGRFKFQGLAGYESWSAEQKAEHHRVFNEIETAAGLVFESFAFKKITWTGAKNGREKARAAFDGYRDKDKYTSFAATLQGANKKYDAAEAACR